MKYTLALFALVMTAWAEEEFTPIVGGISGIATTTHYWDCCKPACAWKGNVKDDMVPVAACAKDGVTNVNASVQSGCEETGQSYMCNNQQPWKVNDTLAYGFAAASFTGGSDVSYCCACMLVTFNDQITDKSMVLQVTNNGPDLDRYHFDIALPGGGVGIFTRGCHEQWNAPWIGWGEQYGGIKSRADCFTLPKELQSGCLFRFDFLKNANNPGVTFKQVTCPSALVKLTGCNLDNN